MTGPRLPILPACRTIACTVRVEHSAGRLHAEVDLDDETDLRPGDQVRVLGEPICVGFDERLELRREAVVRRAGLIGRQVTRVLARFQLAELYEVSFSSGRLS
jgi:hypothetical protein